MKILALEFSSPQRSVAVAGDGRIHGAATETAPRTTRAFALIEEALASAQWERQQIECIAIGIGPGSYAGIRAAIALAQGWQLASPIKLLGISSVECLAAEAQMKRLLGGVNIVIDAQREELYFAQYEISVESFREITPLKLATVEEVRAKTLPGEIIVGPEIHPWFPGGCELFPGAEILARLAATRTNFISGEKLEPIYLRETNFLKAPPPRILP